MSEFLGVLIASLFLGGALGLMALSFTVVFSVGRVFNFAVGQFVIFAGLLVSAVTLTPNRWANALLAVVILVGAGAVVYLLAIWWPESRGAAPLTLVIITFGLGEIVATTTNSGWGGFVRSAPTLVGGSFRVDGNLVPYQGILFLGITVAVVMLLWLVQRFTITGKQVIAIGTTREAAKYYGINNLKVVLLTWMLGFGLLGVVGAFYLPLSTVSMSDDLTFGVQAFAAAVVGGLGNSVGALLGGFLIAFLINAVGVYISSSVVSFAAYAVLLLFLIARPAGLTGRMSELLGPRA